MSNVTPKSHDGVAEAATAAEAAGAEKSIADESPSAFKEARREAALPAGWERQSTENG